MHIDIILFSVCLESIQQGCSNIRGAAAEAVSVARVTCHSTFKKLARLMFQAHIFCFAHLLLLTWQHGPVCLLLSATYNTFKKDLKSHLFGLSYALWQLCILTMYSAFAAVHVAYCTLKIVWLRPTLHYITKQLWPSLMNKNKMAFLSKTTLCLKIIKDF